MKTGSVLLLGATGFIGNSCLKALLSCDNIEIHVLVRNPTQFSSDNEEIEKRIHIIEGDIRDTNAVDRACNKVKTVIHAGSKSIDEDGSGFFDINVEGTKILCESSIKHHVEQFIYLSTCGIYGHKACHGLSEEAIPCPDTPFSKSKYQAEQIILTAHQKGDLKATILRPRFIYGTGDKHVLPRFLKAMEKYPFVISQGRAKLSFVEVNDLSKVILRFMSDDSMIEDPVFNVTDGTPLSIMEMYGILHDIFGKPMPKYSLPFLPLYSLAKTLEFLKRQDPEKKSSSFSSTRIQFIAQDNYFINTKLISKFKDLRFQSFKTGVEVNKDYYKAQEHNP